MKALNAEKLTEYPGLTGPGVKAANTRALLPWAVELSLLVLDGSTYRTRRHKMLANLLLFQTTIQQAGVFLTDEQITTCQRAIRGHLIYYHWLCQEAIVYVSST